MASHQSKAQRATVERVMHEYKEGELRIGGSGPKVKNPKQAIAIALDEAGASRDQSSGEKKRTLSRTKAKERRGQTAEAETEGKKAQDRTLRKGAERGGTDRRSGRRGAEPTKAALYAEARRHDIPGRSKMSKAELERALKRA